MKRKFLTFKEYQEIIKPKEELSFSKESPFNPITLPKTAIFVAWHGPEALMLNCGTGTAYVCRKDDKDPKPLNFDVYSLCLSKDLKTIEIKISPKQKYHWTEDIPGFMKGPVPKWIKEEVKSVTSTEKRYFKSQKIA